MDKNELGKTISKLRKEKNLTQKELSKHLLISDKAISRWETDKAKPDLEMLYLISHFFNVSFTYLLSLRIQDEETDDAPAKGVYEEITKPSTKKNKILKISLGIAMAIILVLVCTNLYVFSSNKFKVYSITSKEDFCLVRGIYISTYKKNIINIETIDLEDSDKDSEVVVQIIFRDNEEEKIIQEFNYLNDINFSLNNNFTEIKDGEYFLDHLYLKIIFDRDEEDSYLIQLKFSLSFSNSKIYEKLVY